MHDFVICLVGELRRQSASQTSGLTGSNAFHNLSEPDVIFLRYLIPFVRHSPPSKNHQVCCDLYMHTTSNMSTCQEGCPLFLDSIPRPYLPHTTMLPQFKSQQKYSATPNASPQFKFQQKYSSQYNLLAHTHLHPPTGYNSANMLPSTIVCIITRFCNNFFFSCCKVTFKTFYLVPMHCVQ